MRLNTGGAEPDLQFAPIPIGQFPNTAKPQRPQGLSQFVRNGQNREW